LTTSIEIPDKLFFKIGEVSRLTDVKAHVLRYWESEFRQLKPQRADSKQRTYQKKDLETLLEIKRLLYEEKMTIEGAKRRLKQKSAARTATETLSLQSIKTELSEIMEMLESLSRSDKLPQNPEEELEEVEEEYEESEEADKEAE